MANIFKTEKIDMREQDFGNLPDYSIHHPPYPQIGDRWKRNVHPKHTLFDRQKLGAKIVYEWWVAEVVRPQDPENENYDIVWARVEVIPIAAQQRVEE
jgi:hypothetical protein